jgi:hypothetical protein
MLIDGKRDDVLLHSEKILKELAFIEGRYIEQNWHPHILSRD